MTGPGPGPDAPTLEEPSLPDLDRVRLGMRRHRRLLGAAALSLLLHLAVLGLGTAARRGSNPPSPAMSVRLQTQDAKPPARAPGRTILVGERGDDGLASRPPAPAPAARPPRPLRTGRPGAAEFQAFPAPPPMFSWWQFSDPDLGYYGPKDVDRPAAPQEEETFLQPLAEVEDLPDGRVQVRVYINERGGVDRVEILASDPPGAFDQAVLRELYRSRFTPALKEGRVVKSRKDLEIGFGMTRILPDDAPPEARGTADSAPALDK